MRPLWLSLCLALAALPAWTGTRFSPIPPEVWGLKEGPKGAVILEDLLRFTGRTVDHVYRVRIFSEAGRGAAVLEDLPAQAFDVEGRTVYPDGREVRFSSRKDFAERIGERGIWGHRETHLIAPGITADCVMEFRWSEPADGVHRGLPFRYNGGRSCVWTLARAYPTRELVVEIEQPFPLGWSLNPGDMPNPVHRETSEVRRMTFRDVPAREVPPYALRSLLRLPTLVMFFQPDELRDVVWKGAEAYWKEASELVFRPDYEEGLGTGSAYRDLVKELTTGLPVAPVQAASELLQRLDRRIANMSEATQAEAAALPEGFWRDMDSRDLERATRTGRTGATGMRLLFFHLLREAGLPTRVAKVPDRNQLIFDWNQLNIWQFTKDLVGVEEPGGGIVWFDPTLRHVTPGVVHPDFTGVPALVLDGRSWKPSRGSVGGLNPEVNLSRFAYELELGEDGEAFKVDAVFGGIPEYAERRRFMALAAPDQSRVLKDRFTDALKDLGVRVAEVRNSADPKAALAWHVEGRREIESGRIRKVSPFPGMPWPMEVPARIEETRSVPIILPHLALQIATSVFQVPEGHALEAQPDLRRENAFGRVLWVARHDGAKNQVQVVLRTELTSLSAGKERWPEFRTLLAWVEEASRRQVTFTKVP